MLEPEGVLIFKWNETQVKVGEVLALTPQPPLFGHLSGRGGLTHWLVFMKPIKNSTTDAPARVTRDECSEAAWQMLGERAERIAELRQELVEAYKELCKYKGHLPIYDNEGRAWCELCESEIITDRES